MENRNKANTVSSRKTFYFINVQPDKLSNICGALKLFVVFRSTILKGGYFPKY